LNTVYPIWIFLPRGNYISKTNHDRACSPTYLWSITACFSVSKADLFSHFGSSSLTGVQSSHSKTNPLVLPPTDCSIQREELVNIFWLGVYVGKSEGVNANVNNYTSTYNTGENLLSSFSGPSVCTVFMCQGASDGRFHCFKPDHLMPGATREQTAPPDVL